MCIGQCMGVSSSVWVFPGSVGVCRVVQGCVGQYRGVSGCGGVSGSVGCVG